jgi:hypothetical protein
VGIVARLGSARGAASAVGFLMGLVGTAVALTGSRAVGVAIASIGVFILLLAITWVRLSVAIVRTAAAEGTLAGPTSLLSLFGVDEAQSRQLLTALQHVGSELDHNIKLLDRIKESGTYSPLGSERLWVMEWNKAKYAVGGEKTMVSLFRTTERAYDEVHRMIGVGSDRQAGGDALEPSDQIDHALDAVRKAAAEIEREVDRLTRT